MTVAAKASGKPYASGSGFVESMDRKLGEGGLSPLLDVGNIPVSRSSFEKSCEDFAFIYKPQCVLYKIGSFFKTLKFFAENIKDFPKEPHI